MKSNCMWVDSSLPSCSSYPLILYAACEYSSSCAFSSFDSLNHCKYIQGKKKKETCLAQQSCGDVTISWSPSRELTWLRPGTAGRWPLGAGSVFRGLRGCRCVHCCLDVALESLLCASGHPGNTRNHPELFFLFFCFKGKLLGKCPDNHC